LTANHPQRLGGGRRCPEDAFDRDAFARAGLARDGFAGPRGAGVFVRVLFVVRGVLGIWRHVNRNRRSLFMRLNKPT
jgi:hypothetical protein